MSARTGIGFDSHRLEEGRRLVLGGVEVPESERGLAGHSDADVLTHAVIDAAARARPGWATSALHFPDTDERWRDADSIELLRAGARAARRARLGPVNVDAVVICEAPKLGAHRDAMRAAAGGGARACRRRT